MLPPLYAGWVDQLLGAPLPDEREATCSDCAMCGEDDRADYFNPHTKCCTYLPELPNFLVGRVLAEPDASAVPGRASVEQRIQSGAEVTPLGLGRRRPYMALYAKTVGGFGHAASMVCPHYLDEQGGLCGVWKHRNAVCSTWFCKIVRGNVGQRLWRAVQRLLMAIEHGLVLHCVEALDVGALAGELLVPMHPTAAELPLEAHELDGRADPKHYDQLWGNWAGREREFYRACAEKVAPIELDEALALGGAEARLAASLLQAAYAEHRRDELPERLKLGPFEVLVSDAERMRIATYSPYDPLDIPRPLADVLHRFDGRPVRDVVETIATADNLEVDRETLRKLTDFEILKPA
jgi:hypothetical protein